MSKIKNLLKDWRMLLVLLVVVVSVVALIPGPQDTGSTSLSFGLELEGGTRLQLDAVGTSVQASGVNAGRNENLTEAAGIPVRVYPRSQNSQIIEFRGNISDQKVKQVLDQQNVDYQPDTIKDQVQPSTLKSLRESIELRLDDVLGAGSGATVTQKSNIVTGSDFIVVSVPGERSNASSIANIIKTQGRFEIQIVDDKAPKPVSPGTSTSNLTNTSHVLYGESVKKGSVSQPLQRRGGGRGGDSFYVSFELSEDGAKEFRNVTINHGATKNPNQHPLVMLFNNDVVFSGPLDPGLAKSIDDGSWQGGGLRVTGLNKSQGRVVSVSLRSGALPTPVKISSQTTISPQQGERFKSLSLVTGLIAVFAVGFVIFFRYRDIRIALPMVLTGLVEVLGLLGFAAIFKFNIDLSHIAGLIAVIGTGMDDLIIIADEVREQGEVRSADVYRKRLKKAFIIIGMAATTTIGAMLPLAFLGLGRISGFAVITIIGVLLGIIVTRPAYGAVLRELITR
ncbi:MAG: hypothetical protein ABEK59_05010 [Halobacteria archaeon]